MASPLPVIRFLDTVGDSSGSKDMNGNFAAAAQSFKAVAPPGKVWIIPQFMFHLGDGGNFTSTGFGAGLGLANGLIVNARIDGTVYNLLDGTTIKNNAQFFHLSPTTANITTFSGGGGVLISDFNATDFGIVGKFSSATNDYLEVIVHDDLSGIDDLHCIARGYSYDLA